MPPSTHGYGVDTSVFVRLLTGHPEKAFRTTVAALEKLHQKESTAELVVSNQVIGEAYITLQHHYGVSKSDARAAILQLFDSGAIKPMGGLSVLNILKTSGGAGLLDRLIADDYDSRGAKVLTNDKRMAKIPGVELLG
ncbi:MAG: type II toxin-antitoxin system VapC family toxin [Oceanipulchritudo sp.]